MANIRENEKNGKTVSYRFTVCLGRDNHGKQIRKYGTWTPPVGLTPAKARKAAERTADTWEQEVRTEFQKEQDAIACGVAYQLPPEKRKDDFAAFVNEVWLPLRVRSGNCKPTTVAFYSNITKIIAAYFDGCTLQQISPIQIQKYLVYLRNDYRTQFGKPLAPKTVRHHYGALANIFNYQEFGQFTKVAEKLKRNPDTVSRYVREYEAEIRGASVALNAKMKGGRCCEKETA